ncbi:MAG TPA: hypothetical protein VLJ61_13785, partial [Pyrinomonadaceae bacterium]|nr:hypothetical protein [Pyrinomonadaceae bacterium]
MEDNVIKATISFDYGSVSKAGKVVNDTYKKMNADAKEANERARQYSEDYAAFWLRAMDKIDAREAKALAERMRQYAQANAEARASASAYASEQNRKARADADYTATWERLLAQRDKREAASRKATLDAEKKAAKEVDSIRRQTMKQAEEQATFREKMAERMASAQKKQNEQAARNNANSLLQQMKSSGSGSTGGGGGSGGGGGAGGSGNPLGGAGGSLLQISAAIDILKDFYQVVQTVVGWLTSLYQSLIAVETAAADYGSEIYKAHLKTRFSTESLSVMKMAAEETGVGFDQLIRAVARYEANLSKSITNPTTEAARALKTMHLTGDALAEAAKNPERAFFNIAKQLEGMDDATKRDRVSLALFGRDFQSLIPVLDQFGSRFDEVRDKAERFGLVLSESQAKKLFEMKVKINDVAAAVKGMFLRVGAESGDRFVELLDTVLNILAALLPAAEAFGKLLAFWLHTNTIAIAGMFAWMETGPTVFRELTLAAVESMTNIQSAIGNAALAGVGLLQVLSGEPTGYGLIAVGPAAA